MKVIELTYLCKSLLLLMMFYKLCEFLVSGGNKGPIHCYTQIKYRAAVCALTIHGRMPHF